MPKNLSAAKENDGAVRFSALNSIMDLRLVADLIIQEVENGEGKRKTYNDYAIIARSKTIVFPAAQSALAINNIPFRLLGGDSVFESPEAKFITSFGSLVAFGSGAKRADKESLVKWSSLLTDIGVSQDAADGICARSRHDVDMGDGTTYGIDGIIIAIRESRVKKENKESALLLANTIKHLRSSRGVVFRNMLESEVVQRTVESLVSSRVEKYMMKRFKDKKMSLTIDEAKAAINKEINERLEGFSIAMSAFADMSIQKAIASLELTAADDGDEHMPKVTISTAHSAKGLEWDTVFVGEANSASWPSGMAKKMLTNCDDELKNAVMDEERRLLYVAVTRAKERLYLMTTNNNAPSDFLPKYVIDQANEIIEKSVAGNGSRGDNIKFEKKQG